MKSFKKLPSRQKLFVVAAGLLAGTFFIMEDDDFSSMSRGDSGMDATYADMAQSYDRRVQTMPGKSSSSEGKVILYDKTSQRPMGTYTLPEGWKLEQDVAIDPSTNRFSRYKIDIHGPQGALIKALGTMQYGHMSGMNFEQSLYQLVASGMQGILDNIRFGSSKPDQQSQQRLMHTGLFKRLASQGTQIQSLILPLQGSFQGKAYEGYVQYTRIMPASNPEMYGTVTATCVIGREGQRTDLLQVKNQIDDQYEKDPSYEQYREQLQAQVLRRQGQFHEEQMRESRESHQTRMRGNQERFNEHQKRIGDLNSIQDKSFENYMDGSNNGNTGYTGHDAFIDGIHERTTFDDPDSGFPRSLDGDYKYNYTDGSGNYYRTDDPGFDPNSLQGDWREIDPMTPEY